MLIIDVSKHNGAIDWARVKNDGVEGTIIRAGYGFNTIDGKFKDNIEGAIRAGLKHIGLYWFGYAYTVKQAEQEAAFFAELAEEYKDRIDIGTFYDWEYASADYACEHGIYPTEALVTAMNVAFCEYMASRGFAAGYYLNLDYSRRLVDEHQLKQFRRWFANWNQGITTPECFIWQYSSKGIVSGIGGNVDVNKLIGEIGEQPEEPEEPQQDEDNKTNEQIAQEVIEGKWGNGYERKKRLKNAGYDYKAVQAIVNQMLQGSDDANVYVVQKGDTLTAIAKKYNTTVKSLVSKNNIKNPDKIYVGQKIYI